jgi:hypothetical protein
VPPMPVSTRSGLYPSVPELSLRVVLASLYESSTSRHLHNTSVRRPSHVHVPSSHLTLRSSVPPRSLHARRATSSIGCSRSTCSVATCFPPAHVHVRATTAPRSPRTAPFTTCARTTSSIGRSRSTCSVATCSPLAHVWCDSRSHEVVRFPVRTTAHTFSHVSTRHTRLTRFHTCGTIPGSHHGGPLLRFPFAQPDPTEVQVRGTRCEVRGARCEVRGARCEVRGARCEVRGTRYEVRGTRFLRFPFARGCAIPGSHNPTRPSTRYEVRGTRHEARGTRYEVRGTRHGARGTRHEVRGTRYEVRGLRYKVFFFAIPVRTRRCNSRFAPRRHGRHVHPTLTGMALTFWASTVPIGVTHIPVQYTRIPFAPRLGHVTSRPHPENMTSLFCPSFF